MRLYKKRVPVIASAIVREFISAGDIDAESPREVELDIASVLETYIDTEREVASEARDMIRSRGLSEHQQGRVRRLIAERKGIKIGDEMLDYVLDQLVAMLWHSNNVDEVYVEDMELRRKMRDVLRKEESLDSDLDREARARLKNIQEGSDTWEIEYKRAIEEIRRRRGM